MIDEKVVPRFEGERVTLGGQEVVVPSLSVRQARRLWGKIIELNAGITLETIPQKYASAIEVIHAALSRNYPDVTVDELEDLIDLSNVRKLILVVAGTSGLNRPGPAPVAATSVSIGPGSTEQS